MNNDALLENIKLISVFNQIPIEMILVDKNVSVLKVNNSFSETFHIQ